MKFIIAAILVMSLTACGFADRVTATATGYATVCVDGVKYYQFTSGATVAYNKDGTVKTC